MIGLGLFSVLQVVNNETVGAETANSRPASKLFLGASFGESQTISLSAYKDRLAIGAFTITLDKDKGSVERSTGAVYILKRNDNRWQLEQKISNKTDGVENLNKVSAFAANVSLTDNYLAISNHESNKSTIFSGDQEGRGGGLFTYSNEPTQFGVWIKK